MIRPHSKSRNGCGQCKKRRVKCNQQGPICSNCARRKEACDYQERAEFGIHAILGSVGDSEDDLTRCRAFRWVNHPVASTLPALLVAARNRERHHTNGNEIDIERTQTPTDASLWDHFRDRTRFHVTLLTHRGEDTTWSDTTSLAACHGYLRHIILAVSALHLVHFEADFDSPAGTNDNALERHLIYYRSAVAHSMHGSGLFVDDRTPPDDSNWQARLTYAVIQVVFELDVILVANKLGVEAGKHTPARLVDILSRPQDLAKELARWMWRSPMGKAIAESERGVRPCIPDAQVQRYLESLGRLDAILPRASTTVPDETRHACMLAAGSLRSWVIFTSAQPRSWMDLSIWPASLSPAFRRLLDGWEEFALLVFVHWCVVMNQTPNRYFLRPVIQQVAEAALSKLEGWFGKSVNAGNVLSWTRRELETEPGILSGWMRV